MRINIGKETVLYMKQRADGVLTIIFTKLTSLTWKNVFNSRKLLDFGYAFQSTDEQISDIRETSDFCLQH